MTTIDKQNAELIEILSMSHTTSNANIIIVAQKQNCNGITQKNKTKAN